ncbi:MAG: glycosyltransferase, partial [Bacteroidaceae bacterium]|nr:glycosyltransferase [Bacteroidaceae bacterium]
SDSFLKRISIKLINKIKLWIYYHLSPSVFYRLFVRGVYDVEVAFIEGEATRIISGSTNKKSRKLAWVHIDLESNHWTKCSYRKDEEARSYGRYDKILGVSDTVCAAFQREFPSVSVPVETMYNAVDTEDILSKAQESVDTEHERIRLVTVGRLEAQKGYARLLRIVNKLVEEGVDIELWILGEGSERGVLEQYMMEHRLQERVFLLGFQPNPYKYLAQGDLFVCSSLAEGYSTAVTEALVLGLPVVTTACSGMEELLQGGKYGVITANSEESLYEGLKKVLSDVEKLSYYRCKAQERGTNLFGTSNPAERLERLLD